MLRQKRVTPVRVRSPGSNRQTELGTAAAEFVTWTVSVGLSPDTARIRRCALERFLSWAEFSNVCTPGDITLDCLERYQAHLATYRKKDGLLIAGSTRAARLNPVLAFCRWLVRQGLIAEYPAARLVIPRQVRRLPPRVPTTREIRAILAEPDTATPAGLRDRAIMETFYSTALRRMELARLEPGDFNLEAHLVHVRAGKGARDRVVPLGERAALWVRRYLLEIRPRMAMAGSPRSMFLTDYGEAFDKNRLGDMVRRHVVNSGFPGRGACHLFRHASATHMLENGADIRFIQAMLGHAQLSTTEIYTHVSIRKLLVVHANTHPAGRGG